MEQVAEGSCESLLLVEQSKERKGRLAQAAWDMLGQGLWERCTGRAAAGQDRSSQLGGITPEHTACCEQLWEASQEKGSWRNKASCCFPQAWTPNMVHLSSVMIKSQQSY